MNRDKKVIKDLMLHKCTHLCTNFVLVFSKNQLNYPFHNFKKECQTATIELGQIQRSYFVY